MAVILVPRIRPENRPAESPAFEAGDLLEGAAEIARYMFGPEAHARRAHTAIRRGLPIFRIGNRLYARKSKISEWIASQERTSVAR